MGTSHKPKDSVAAIHTENADRPDTVSEAADRPVPYKRANACEFEASHMTTQVSTYGAVAELMSSPKRVRANPSASAPESARSVKQASKALASRDPRNGLSVYIDQPETNPEGLVVEYDDDFVVINDKFPKARSAISTLVWACGKLRIDTACTFFSFPAARLTTPNNLYTFSLAIQTSWRRYVDALPISKNSRLQNFVVCTEMLVCPMRRTKQVSKR